MNNNHNLTETDIDNIDIKSPLEHQLQQQELQDSGWRFDKNNSMTIYFYKIGEINGTSYVKIPLRSNAILNNENNDKFCFIWSKVASLHPCRNNHPNKESNSRQYFNELKIDRFDFTKRFKCKNVQIIENLNNLSVNIFEQNFYQGQKFGDIK